MHKSKVILVCHKEHTIECVWKRDSGIYPIIKEIARILQMKEIDYTRLYFQTPSTMQQMARDESAVDNYISSLDSGYLVLFINDKGVQKNGLSSEHVSFSQNKSYTSTSAERSEDGFSGEQAPSRPPTFNPQQVMEQHKIVPDEYIHKDSFVKKKKLVSEEKLINQNIITAIPDKKINGNQLDKAYNNIYMPQKQEAVRREQLKQDVLRKGAYTDIVSKTQSDRLLNQYEAMKYEQQKNKVLGKCKSAIDGPSTRIGTGLGAQKYPGITIKDKIPIKNVASTIDHVEVKPAIKKKPVILQSGKSIKK